MLTLLIESLVPEIKPIKIYAEVFEKNFGKYPCGYGIPEFKNHQASSNLIVCPKFEKVVIVKVPAKCACGSIEVKPKIVKAPEFKELPYESKVVKEEFVKESIYGKEGYGKEGYGKEGYGYGKLY